VGFGLYKSCPYFLESVSWSNLAILDQNRENMAISHSVHFIVTDLCVTVCVTANVPKFEHYFVTKLPFYNDNLIVSMAKKSLKFRISEEQEKKLLAEAKSLGFLRKADYIRFKLFMSDSMNDKLNKIYEKVCQDGN